MKAKYIDGSFKLKCTSDLDEETLNEVLRKSMDSDFFIQVESVDFGEKVVIFSFEKKCEANF